MVPDMQGVHAPADGDRRQGKLKGILARSKAGFPKTWV
jgi:hypothetical protein